MTKTKVKAYAAQSATSALASLGITRREPGPLDVEIEILYCGVCHSDLHQARNEWHNTVYPCVPGHEIVARVTRAGHRVTRRELAHHYLKQSTVELTETAFLLGYEDANSFFRAFHLWEGTSPGEWRTLHRRTEVAVSGG